MLVKVYRSTYAVIQCPKCLHREYLNEEDGYENNLDGKIMRCLNCDENLTLDE